MSGIQTAEQTAERIRQNQNIISDYIKELFFFSKNYTGSQMDNYKLYKNYFFCCKIGNFINDYFKNGYEKILEQKLDSPKDLKSFIGNENNIDDDDFPKILFHIYIEICGLFLVFDEIKDEIQKKTIIERKREREKEIIKINKLEITINNEKKKIEISPADPITVLNDKASKKIFNCNFDVNARITDFFKEIETGSIIDKSNKINIKQFCEKINDDNFKTKIKNLLDIDLKIIDFVESQIFKNMEIKQKMGIRVLIIEMFKSQIGIMSKLLCTMRTKIDFPEKEKEEPKLNPIPFYLPTRMPSSQISGDNSISNIARILLTKNPFGNRIMGKGHIGGSIYRENFEKIIYKQYKYLYLIYKYVNKNYLF
jgi:hypothetical protein